MSEFKCNHDCSCCEILCSDAIEKNNQSLDALMDLLKQKDAEIEKKDALLKEAVELLISVTESVSDVAKFSDVQDFIKKLEVNDE